MTRLLLMLVFGISATAIMAQSFEGVIKYKSESVTDTVFITYNVRNSLIRVDEAFSDGKIYRSTIVNVKSNQVTAIDPNKKLYTEIYPEPHNQYSPSDFSIKRTGNTRDFNGYKCYQWRVRNQAANSEVAYWVAEENFEFFDDLLRILPMNENSLTFFLSIPQPDGFLPMHVCERTLLRDVKQQLSLLEIDKKILDGSIFQVPVEYSEYQVSR